jgi:hypothetical protein
MRDLAKVFQMMPLGFSLAIRNHWRKKIWVACSAIPRKGSLILKAPIVNIKV